MNTTSKIKHEVRIAVEFKGAAPIDGGTLLFTSENTADDTIAAGQIRAHRITYSDLIVSGANRVYRVTFTNGELNNPTSVNLLNELIELQNYLSFAYVKTNTAVAITGSFPFPATLPAGGQALVTGDFQLDPLVSEPGTVTLTLTWTQTALNAIGTGNFYCDLILA